MAVVEHLGDAYGGHYVCYGRRDPAAADAAAEWLLFNDANVRRASLVEVRVCAARPWRMCAARCLCASKSRPRPPRDAPSFRAEIRSLGRRISYRVERSYETMHLISGGEAVV